MPEKPDNIVPITPDARSAAEKFSAEHDRELLTILFTDLVDSTKLQSDLGNMEAARLTELHREIVRDELAKYDAREIEWAGDSCLAVFTRPSDAVVFALRMQAEHRRVRETEPKLQTVRVGMHLGEIVVKKGPKKEDLFGLQISEAARVMSIARGNQIFCTRAVFDSARSSLKGQTIEGIGDAVWVNYGAYLLKGSEDPVEICEIGSAEVAVMKAPEATDKVFPLLPGGVATGKSQGTPKWAMAILVLLLVGVSILAGSLALDLKGGSGRATSVEAPIRSLAVLPFENNMGDESKEYYVDGMTDTLTAELSKIGSIKVIARTSAMRFKGSDKPLREIARELGVEALIEGSVQLFGDELRITAQLVDGRTEEHLWGENFEGTLAGVMKLQGEVAVSIAEQIGAVLTPEQRHEYADAKDVNPEAYDLYLQGRSIMQGRTEDGFRVALNLFERALLLDPEFALPHTGMADVYALLSLYNFFSFVTLGEATEKAFEHARKAVELDASLADAHVSLGWVLTQFDVDRNWAMAEREFRRAIELNPGLARARFRYGWLLISLGRNSDGVREMRLALDLNPLDPIALTNLGYALQYSGQYDEAVEAYLRAIETDPSLSAPYSQLYLLYRGLGRIDEALNFAQKVYDIAHSPYDEWNVIFFSALLKGREALLALVAEVEQGEHDARLLHGRAVLYFSAGDTVEALKHAEKNVRSGAWSAMDIRSLQRIESFKSDPAKRRRLDDDPRFWEMLDKYNLPPLPAEHPRYAKEQAYLRQKAAEAALAAQPKPVRRYRVDVGSDYPLASGSGFRDRVLAVSPDGSRLVYQSSGRVFGRQLVLRERDRLNVQPIAGTEEASRPFFSPDGSRVGFFADGLWKSVHLDDGRIEVLAEAGFGQGAAWDENGTIVLSGSVRQGLLRYSTTNELLEILTTVDLAARDAVHAMPHVLPDGRGLLYTVSQSPGVSATRVEALCFETGERVVIASAATIPQYLPTGHILYARAGALMAVAFSLEEFRVVGSPVAIREAGLSDGDSVPGSYAVSDDGTLWYASGSDDSGLRQYIWIDLEGNEEPTALPAQELFPLPALSPDGTRIVVDDGRDIYVADLALGTTSRLTFDDAVERNPIWGPRGESVWYSTFANPFSIRYRLATGRGDAIEAYRGEQTDEIGSFFVRSWTPDGKQGIGTYPSSNTGVDVGVLDLSGTPSISPLIARPGTQTAPRLSNDGRWLAYVSIESGRAEVYVQPYPSLDGMWQITQGGGNSPQWAPDDSRIYVIRGNSVVAIPVETEPGFSHRREELLFSRPYISGAYPVVLAPDGTRFLTQKPVEVETRTRKLIVVENWFEELERLAPHPEAN